MFAVETHQPHRIVLYETLSSAQRGLAQQAREWACKEVGEKHVHEALDQQRQLADYPDGLILHYEETPGEKTVCATRKQTLHGWWSSPTIEYTPLNRFSMLPAEVAEGTRAALPTPTVMEQRGGSMDYEDVLKELRETLERRRKRLQ